MTTTESLTLADLATTIPAASRVFRRHALDFCCRGRRTLAEACAARSLDPDLVAAEIALEAARSQDEADGARWDLRPTAALVEHILARYHVPLRGELARLLEMAVKVERVHADKAACPHGLAAHLTTVSEEVERHLSKEEQILFPMILRSGGGGYARMPVHVLMLEHEDHGEALRRTRGLTADLVAPPEACATWRALYLGLEQLEADLFAHIHLENNVLFPRVLEDA
jgi:regulator of cell morphogenesis and NO signaling